MAAQWGGSTSEVGANAWPLIIIVIGLIVVIIIIVVIIVIRVMLVVITIIIIIIIVVVVVVTECRGPTAMSRRGWGGRGGATSTLKGSRSRPEAQAAGPNGP